MMSFEEIVASIDVEPFEVVMLRVMLFDDWTARHPGDPSAGLACAVVDEIVDDLRDYWGRGFDCFVEAGRFVE